MSDSAHSLSLEEFGDEKRAAERLHRIALTCHYFSQGYPPAKIKETLEKVHDIRVSRETPYNDLLHAAKLGYLEFKRPLASKAEERLKKALHKRYSHTENVRLAVVQTHTRDDVGATAASVIRNLVEEAALKHVREKLKPAGLADKYIAKEFVSEEGHVPVHIGFGGGRTLGTLTHRLGAILQRDLENIDAEIQNEVATACEKEEKKAPASFYQNFRLKLVLHNLVAGFDYTSPLTHPIAFLYQMIAGTTLAFPGRTEFCCFSSAPYSQDPEESAAADPTLTKRAAKDAVKLDIVVGSAGSFEDESSALRRFYEPPHVEDKQSKYALEHFDECNCRGDFFWQPINDDGPLPPPKKKKGKRALGYRPATLIKLQDLPKMINKGTKVVLAMGPSESEPGAAIDKAGVLQAILRQKPQLVTHAIIDVDTARNTTKWLEDRA